MNEINEALEYLQCEGCDDEGNIYNTLTEWRNRNKRKEEDQLKGEYHDFP